GVRGGPRPVASAGAIDAAARLDRIAAVIGGKQGGELLRLTLTNRRHPGRGTVAGAAALRHQPLRLDAVMDGGHHRRCLERPGASGYLDAALVHSWISTSSISVPARSRGCTKAMRAPRPPMRGSASIRRAPCSARWASAASMSTTA